MVQDRRFYTELIRQCEVVLPVVDKILCLCYLSSLFKLNMLESVCGRVADSMFQTNCGYGFYSKKPGRDFDGYNEPPAWKQDRIELLEEIINYCKSKL
jgi:hypothetical protein